MIMVLFELPCDRYLAFRYTATEIIENISFILNERGPDGNYPVKETQQFIQFITPGFKNKLTEEATSKCFSQLCKHTKSFIHEFTSEIIETLIPDQVKDWKCEEGTINILKGISILVCEE